MSSLRLALKQSLAEASATGAPGGTFKTPRGYGSKSSSLKNTADKQSKSSKKEKHSSPHRNMDHNVGDEDEDDEEDEEDNSEERKGGLLTIDHGVVRKVTQSRKRRKSTNTTPHSKDESHSTMATVDGQNFSEEISSSKSSGNISDTNNSITNSNKQEKPKKKKIRRITVEHAPKTNKIDGRTIKRKRKTRVKRYGDDDHHHVHDIAQENEDQSHSHQEKQQQQQQQRFNQQSHRPSDIIHTTSTTQRGRKRKKSMSNNTATADVGATTKSSLLPLEQKRRGQEVLSTAAASDEDMSLSFDDKAQDNHPTLESKIKLSTGSHRRHDRKKIQTKKTINHHNASGSTASSMVSSIKNSSSSSSSLEDTEGKKEEEEEMVGIFDSECSTCTETQMKDYHHQKKKINEQQYHHHLTALAKALQNQWKKTRTMDTQQEEEEEGEESSGIKKKKKEEEDDDDIHPTTSPLNIIGVDKKKMEQQKLRTCVPAPTKQVRSWIKNMGQIKQQKEIFPGMRVKVRFQVDLETLPTKDPTTPSSEKRQTWFGGCVVAVAEEGKIITVKYDDGTSELIEFPDKDVIVDDVQNGRHLTNAPAFIPPILDEGKTIPCCEIPLSPIMDRPQVDHIQTKDMTSSIPSNIMQPYVVQNEDNEIKIASLDKVDCSGENPHDADLGLDDTKPLEIAAKSSCPSTPRKENFESSTLDIDVPVPASNGALLESNFTGQEKVSLYNHSSPKPYSCFVTSQLLGPLPLKSFHDTAEGANDDLKSSYIERPSSTAIRESEIAGVSDIPTSDIINMGNQTVQEDPKTPKMDIGKAPCDDTSSPIVASEAVALAGNAELIVTIVPPPLTGSTTKKDSADTSTTHESEKDSMKKIIKDKISKKRKQSSRSDDNGSKEPKIEDLWVACDRCKKWRKLPGFMMESLPDLWYCENNTHDPKRNNCDASEESYEDQKEAKKKSSVKAKLIRDLSMTSQKSSQSSFDDDKMSSNANKPISVRVSSVSANESTLELNPVKSPRQFNSSSSSIYLNKTEGSNTPIVPARSYGSLDGTAGEMGESTTPTPLSPKPKPGRKPNSVTSSILPTPTLRIAKEEEKKPTRSAVMGATAVTGGGVKGKAKETVQQEWVQCEQCQKWRRLPSTVAAADLPDYWICTMNTWDPRSASCAVQEDYKKDDEEHLNAKGVRENTILGNASGGTERTGKLSYRTLLAGNGKRPFRPISDKARYAESIFLPPSNMDVPPRPMYADSSVYRSSHAHSNEDNSDPSMDLFTMLSHSKLWTILSKGAVVKEEKEGHIRPTAPSTSSKMTTIDPNDMNPPVFNENRVHKGMATSMESTKPTNSGNCDTITSTHVPEFEMIQKIRAPSSRVLKISKPWKNLAEPMA